MQVKSLEKSSVTVPNSNNISAAEIIQEADGPVIVSERRRGRRRRSTFKKGAAARPIELR